MKLKDNLRFLRRKAGLTQAELAKKMHIVIYWLSKEGGNSYAWHGWLFG